MEGSQFKTQLWKALRRRLEMKIHKLRSKLWHKHNHCQGNLEKNGGIPSRFSPDIQLNCMKNTFSFVVMLILRYDICIIVCSLLSN